jgi:hypothetical protein
LSGYDTDEPFASVTSTLYWTTWPSGWVGIAPVHVWPASASGTVPLVVGSSRSCQLTIALCTAGGGQAALPATTGTVIV